MPGFAKWVDARLDRVGDADLRTLFAIVRGLPASSWPEPADPDRVLVLADKNRISGEVTRRVRAATGSVPRWVDALALGMRVRAMAVAHVYDQQAAAVRDVGDAFVRHGVAALVVKGFHLAHAVYPDPAERPFGDIDLLVRPADRAVAERTLRGLGYEPALVQLGEGAIEDCFVRDRGLAGKVELDLHWKLVGPLSLVREMRLDVDGFFARSSPAFSGLRFPSVEDALTLAAVNLVRHGFRPLGNILDFRELLGRADPEALLARARESRVTAALGVSLALAEALFGATVPDRVAAGLSLPLWQQAVFRRLLRAEALAQPELADSVASRYVAKVLVQDGVGGVVRTMAAMPRVLRSRRASAATGAAG